jgi:hypothetical protein
MDDTGDNANHHLYDSVHSFYNESLLSMVRQGFLAQWRLT